MKPNLDLGSVNRQFKLSNKNFFTGSGQKKQIYIHHTVTPPDPLDFYRYLQGVSHPFGTFSVIAGKPYNPVSHTHFRDGEIFQLFPSKYWSIHLGIHLNGNHIPEMYKTKNRCRELEKNSIGISLCNWGWLEWKNGCFKPQGDPLKPVISNDEVIQYTTGYRGHQYYQKYSLAQIESLRQLLVFLCEEYQIPKTYNPDMWEINEAALSGKPGIYSHSSVRTDKDDCHPQPELVQMLMDLETMKTFDRNPSFIFKQDHWKNG